MKKDLLKGLTGAQIEKVRSCKSSEELLKLAKAEGVELSDEQLEAVSGGACFEPRKPTETTCLQCGSSNISWDDYDMSDTSVKCHCNECGFEWNSSLR